MTTALQVATWPNPIDIEPFTNVYATVTAFRLDVEQQRYDVEVSVFVDQGAFQAGKHPIATLRYRSVI